MPNWGWLIISLSGGGGLGALVSVIAERQTRRDFNRRYVPQGSPYAYPVRELPRWLRWTHI